MEDTDGIRIGPDAVLQDTTAAAAANIARPDVGCPKFNVSNAAAKVGISSSRIRNQFEAGTLLRI